MTRFGEVLLSHLRFRRQSLPKRADLPRCLSPGVCNHLRAACFSIITRRSTKSNCSWGRRRAWLSSWGCLNTVCAERPGTGSSNPTHDFPEILTRQVAKIGDLSEARPVRKEMRLLGPANNGFAELVDRLELLP